MSQLPQNNEAFDYNPEYAKLYQEDDSEQSSPDASDEQLLSANESPDDSSDGSPDEPADQAVGKGMANFSILFGFLGPLSFFLGGWLVPPVVWFLTVWGYAFSSVSPSSSC